MLVDTGKSVPGFEGAAAWGWPHISVAEVKKWAEMYLQYHYVPSWRA